MDNIADTAGDDCRQLWMVQLVDGVQCLAQGSFAAKNDVLVIKSGGRLADPCHVIGGMDGQRPKITARDGVQQGNTALYPRKHLLCTKQFT